MSQFVRWFAASSIAGLTALNATPASACWFTDCFGLCGGAPRTTFYAPTAAVNPCSTCSTNPCASGTCGTPTTTFMPTVPAYGYTAPVPTTTFRPLLGGWGQRPTAVPYTAAYPSYLSPQPSPGFMPYTSYRPGLPATLYQPYQYTAAYAPISYATPTTSYYAPSYSAPLTTTYSAPMTSSVPSPSCGCNGSTTTVGAPITSYPASQPVMSGTATGGTYSGQYAGSQFTTGTTSTTVTSPSDRGQPTTNSPTPADANKPVTDPQSTTVKPEIRGSSGSPLTPGRELDPENRQANLRPLHTPVQQVSLPNRITSFDDLAPANDVRMTSNSR
jgi:hypothetical protein